MGYSATFTATPSIAAERLERVCSHGILAASDPDGERLEPLCHLPERHVQTFDRVDSVNPTSEVGAKKAGQIEQHMMGSDGANSNFGEVGIFGSSLFSVDSRGKEEACHPKSCFMRGWDWV